MRERGRERQVQNNLMLKEDQTLTSARRTIEDDSLGRLDAHLLIELGMG